MLHCTFSFASAAATRVLVLWLLLQPVLLHLLSALVLCITVLHAPYLA